MQNFLGNNRMVVFIVILAIGSISGIVTVQFVMGLDGGNINGSIIACVYGACKDNTFNGGTSGGGGGGGGQPTSTTLKVTKVVVCDLNPDNCPAASTFTIEVIKSDTSTESFLAVQQELR